MGIITGIGGAFAGVGIVRLIHQHRTAPEKLREEEIERTDERNVQILRASYSLSNTAAAVLFAFMVIIFSAMGSITESYISLAALMLQQLIFMIGQRYYSSKM